MRDAISSGLLVMPNQINDSSGGAVAVLDKSSHQRLRASGHESSSPCQRPQPSEKIRNCGVPNKGLKDVTASKTWPFNPSSWPSMRKERFAIAGGQSRRSR